MVTERPQLALILQSSTQREENREESPKMFTIIPVDGNINAKLSQSILKTPTSITYLSEDLDYIYPLKDVQALN